MEKNYLCCCFLLFFLLLWTHDACPQGDSLKKTTETFGGLATTGYAIVLSVPYKRTRRSYWEYLSTFAFLRLKRDYWELSVSLGEDDFLMQKRIPVLYAHVEPHEEGSKLYLGVSSAYASKRTDRWEEEVMHTLFLFRLRLYEEELQRLLVENERAYLLKNKEAVLLQMRKTKWIQRIARYKTHRRRNEWQEALSAVEEALQDAQSNLHVLLDKKRSYIRGLSQLQESPFEGH